MKGEEGPRKIKLFCPSLSKFVQLVAWEEQKVDLGSIARAFGVEPSTVKLNGHFIGRGVDLVASSVTWRSLLSFFSAKGLSTGKDDGDALIVDGKLSKVGCKRGQESQDSLDGTRYKKKSDGDGMGRSSWPGDDMDMLKNKKLRDCCSGYREGDPLLSSFNCLGSKRKQLPEDISSLKKLKINETSIGCAGDIPERGNCQSSGVLASPFKCRFVNGNMKRMREDEVFVSAAWKRMR